MSVINATPLLAAAGGDYQISRSVRLRSSASAYFNRTPASAGNRQKFTWSGWVKRGALANTLSLFSAGTTSPTYDGFRFDSSDRLQFFQGGGSVSNLVTTQVFRDPSAWYHIVLSVDTTQATSSSRVVMYVNNTQITSFSTSTYPAQNTSASLNNNLLHVLAAQTDSGAVSVYFDGYLTEINFIDGQALTPSSFGETDSITGVWKPKKYAGTYGTNGFYLNFSDNSLNTDVTSTATATAPFGGTADNAKISDGVYLTTNTSTGSAFDVVKYDFGASVQMTRFVVGAFSFSGGSSTFQIQVSNDDSTYTTVSSLSVTSTGTNYSGSINAYARYVKLRATAFGTNGQATLDVFQILQDGIGKDYSGNGNNWTPNNISVTAGATYDSMLDVPTLYADGGNGRGNYATLNPIVESSGSPAGYVDGNLKANGTASTQKYGYVTIRPNGKFYAEFAPFNVPSDTANFVGISSPFARYYASNGQVYNGSSWVSYGATYSAGDTIGMAIDTTAGTLEFFKNNTSQGQLTGLTTGEASILLSMGIAGGVAGWNANFGQRPFAYTPPTGFKALNTQNLPEPTIKKGNQYFDVSLYTGNATARSITGVGFQPDFVWAKSRSGAESHRLYDAVRGATQSLYSNLTNAETTEAQSLTAFNSDGFSLGTGAPNSNAVTYVAWQWKESPSAGFDIVTYTGTGVARTVAHSLGVKPSMMIVKNRSSGTTGWAAYHSALGATKVLELNTTSAAVTASGEWNNTEPTSSVFTVGTSSWTNNNTNSIVAYLFAEVAGFSKFGSYTGNGSADGPFVFCGFRPRFIMFKRTDAVASWRIIDTARESVNATQNEIYPNLSNAEAGAANGMDVLSNGFKLRGSYAEWNASGGTFIFAAFAENPFKNSLAR